MNILLWLWFLLVLVLLVAIIIFVAMYNTLIHLRSTCQNTATDLCTRWLQKAGKITEPTIMPLIATCHKATTLEKQVQILNKLRAASIDLWTRTAEGKKITALESAMQTEKRFFNNTARELQERLTLIPTSFIWSFFAITAPKFLDLAEEAHTGLLPEAKYL